MSSLKLLVYAPKYIRAAGTEQQQGLINLYGLLYSIGVS